MFGHQDDQNDQSNDAGSTIVTGPSDNNDDSATAATSSDTPTTSTDTEEPTTSTDTPTDISTDTPSTDSTDQPATDDSAPVAETTDATPAAEPTDAAEPATSTDSPDQPTETADAAPAAEPTPEKTLPEPVESTASDTVVTSAPDITIDENPPAGDADSPAKDDASTDSSTEPTLKLDGLTESSNDDLLTIKKDALEELSPLVDQLDQTPEEKFHTKMMMIQASDNQALIQSAYDAAKQITDEKIRAQALLDIVNEINYFTQHQQDKTEIEVTS